MEEEKFTSKKDIRKKKVVQLNLLDGFFVNEFSSVAQAARETGISKSGIAKTCRGLNKTAGGYLWKYN